MIEAHERGIVTSASLMVRFPAAREAAAYDRLSLGLHIDLGEWTVIGGEWAPVYERQDGAGEIEAQIDEFRRLVGRDPTHLDSHHHVHQSEPVASTVRSLGEKLGVPVRQFSRIRYCGDFYGQASFGEPYPEAIGFEGLLRTIASLPLGWTELACHPGYADFETTYAAEREVELRTLCDPRLPGALEDAGVELRSFADV